MASWLASWLAAAPAAGKRRAIPANGAPLVGGVVDAVLSEHHARLQLELVSLHPPDGSAAAVHRARLGVRIECVHTS